MTPTIQIPKEQVTKAFYALLGAPVLTTAKLRELSKEVGRDLSKELSGLGVDEFAAEGEKLASRLQDRKVVEQVQHKVEDVQAKVDVEQLQVQVEKLRDQLEGVLANWRETFAPVEKRSTVSRVPVEAEESAPKKTAPKKTTARKTAPKKTTAKKTTAKKTTAKKTAPKKTTAKKTTTPKA